MPDRLSFHTPVLANTIGHFAGAVAFGILLYLLVIDWRRNRSERGPLPSWFGNGAGGGQHLGRDRRR